MDLVLSEEQELLQQTAREFVAGRSSLKRIRALRDANDPDGFSRDLWRELARSAVMNAARAVDEGRDDAAVARAASIAKARCSDTFVLIGNEAVQMHGGIGMTDEHDIGFFLKRARAAEMTFGDAAWHRDRVAGLDGY